MVVLNEKDLIPPPPYFAIEQENKASSFFLGSSSLPFSGSTSTVHLPLSSSSASASGSTSGRSTRSLRRTAPPLPSHVLLLIVYSTLPVHGEYRLDRATGVRRRESAEEMAVRTTRTLFWMAFCLRAVNRGFYLASMHILRSTFLPHYVQRVRVPYSSDPFPHTSASPHRQSANSSALGYAYGRTPASVVSSMQCESEVLDLYILHQLHEDVFTDDTSLHISRPERLRDLFDFMQPRARLTDLVRAFGVGAGLVALSEEELRLSAYDADHGEEEVADTVSLYSTRSFASSSTSTSTEKRAPAPGPGLNLKSRLARSTSTLTLINPTSGPGPSASSSSTPGYANLPSPAASQIKFQTYASSPSIPSLRRRVASPAQQIRKKKKKILYTALRVSFSPRRVGLVYTPLTPPSQADAGGPRSGTVSGGGSSSTSASTSASETTTGPRTIVDIPRDREEPLERSASRLVAGLKTWLEGR